MTTKYKVLFLCRDNSVRSIIAEALLRELAGHRFEAFSAGPEPAARVHSLALAQLRRGISGRDVLSPKSWLEFTGEWAPRMDVVIALDESVGKNRAPTFPGAPAMLGWCFADPLAHGMSDDERERLFDKMFWQIVRQVSAFIELPQYTAPPVRDPGARIGAAATSASTDTPRANDILTDHPASDSANTGPLPATFTSPDQTTRCTA